MEKLIISKALKNPIDYIYLFTDQMEVLKEALSLALNTEVKHDADMSYKAGQLLSFLVSEISRNHEIQPYSIEARVYVSSKAKLFAIYCFDLKYSFTSKDSLNHPL